MIEGSQLRRRTLNALKRSAARSVQGPRVLPNLTLGLGARARQQGGLKRIAFARSGTGDGDHDARKGGSGRPKRF